MQEQTTLDIPIIFNLLSFHLVSTQYLPMAIKELKYPKSFDAQIDRYVFFYKNLKQVVKFLKTEEDCTIILLRNDMVDDFLSLAKEPNLLKELCDYLIQNQVASHQCLRLTHKNIEENLKTIYDNFHQTAILSTDYLERLKANLLGVNEPITQTNNNKVEPKKISTKSFKFALKRAFIYTHIYKIVSEKILDDYNDSALESDTAKELDKIDLENYNLLFEKLDDCFINPRLKKELYLLYQFRIIDEDTLEKTKNLLVDKSDNFSFIIKTLIKKINSIDLNSSSSWNEKRKFSYTTLCMAKKFYELAQNIFTMKNFITLGNRKIKKNIPISDLRSFFMLLKTLLLLTDTVPVKYLENLLSMENFNLLIEPKNSKIQHFWKCLEQKEFPNEIDERVKNAKKLLFDYVFTYKNLILNARQELLVKNNMIPQNKKLTSPSKIIMTKQQTDFKDNHKKQEDKITSTHEPKKLPVASNIFEFKKQLVDIEKKQFDELAKIKEEDIKNRESIEVQNKLKHYGKTTSGKAVKKSKKKFKHHQKRNNNCLSLSANSGSVLTLDNYQEEIEKDADIHSSQVSKDQEGIQTAEFKLEKFKDSDNTIPKKNSKLPFILEEFQNIIINLKNISLQPGDALTKDSFLGGVILALLNLYRFSQNYKYQLNAHTFINKDEIYILKNYFINNCIKINYQLFLDFIPHFLKLGDHLKNFQCNGKFLWQLTEFSLKNTLLYQNKGVIQKRSMIKKLEEYISLLKKIQNMMQKIDNSNALGQEPLTYFAIISAIFKLNCLQNIVFDSLGNQYPKLYDLIKNYYVRLTEESKHPLIKIDNRNDDHSIIDYEILFSFGKQIGYVLEITNQAVDSYKNKHRLSQHNSTFFANLNNNNVGFDTNKNLAYVRKIMSNLNSLTDDPDKNIPICKEICLYFQALDKSFINYLDTLQMESGIMKMINTLIVTNIEQVPLDTLDLKENRDFLLYALEQLESSFSSKNTTNLSM